MFDFSGRPAPDPRHFVHLELGKSGAQVNNFFILINVKTAYAKQAWGGAKMPSWAKLGKAGQSLAG